MITSYIIPIIFLSVLIISIIRKKDAYSLFVDGTRNALTLVISVFPYLITIMIAVEIFRASGVSEHIANFLAPALKLVGLPKELTELILIRPLSGAGALGILENIFDTYGVDTYIGNCASIIYGSSETIFYISAIYFSKSQPKKLMYAIPLSLFCTFIGCIVGCFIMKFI